MAEGAVEQISIHEAAREGNVLAVRRCLSADPDARNDRDRLSRTPLHLGAWAGHAEVVRLLCEVGADVGAAAMDDMAAIHFACQKGHTEVVRILLAGGAYVNARNRKGMTPLHFAVQGKNEELTKLLIRKGANLSTENRARKKPIDLAHDESFKTFIREAEQERIAQRAKNKEKGKVSSGMEGVAQLDRQGEEADEIRPITVPERPAEPQCQEDTEVMMAITVPERPAEPQSQQDTEVMMPITVPERPATAPEKQMEDVVNGTGPANVEIKLGVEVVTKNEEHPSVEPRRKKPKVSLLSFGDDNEDEVE